MRVLHNPTLSALKFAVFAALLALTMVFTARPALASHSHHHSHEHSDAAPAAPPKPKAVVAAPLPAGAVPDYGGRDSSPLAAAGDAAPNPAAQAGRALVSLVIVLAGVGGAVYALKRFGIVTPGADGQPARIRLPSFGNLPVFKYASGHEAGNVAVNAGLTVVSSQTLPGGTMLHVVRVAEKNLLLAATSQTVTSVAEWPAEYRMPEEGPSLADGFEEYLVRADSHSGIAAANARLRSLLSPTQTEELS